jgi:autotransporter-associated beta strand protein
LNGYFAYIDALSGSGHVDLGSRFLVVGDANGSSTFNGLISGEGSFYKYGSGTITLTANNTYTGTTYPYQGKLAVNGLQPQSPVYVYPTGTLGGTGTVGEIFCAGILAPGASPGILTCSNLTFSSMGTYAVELAGLNAGTGYDQMNVRGTNNLANATLSLNATYSSPVAPGQQFVIINNDGTDPITGTFNGLTNGSTLSVGGFKYSVNYAGGTGNDVVLTLTDVPAGQAGSSVLSGNGNAAIDPNECASLNLVISNKTSTPITGISAVLTTAEPNVVVTRSSASYPNAPAYGRSTNSAAFQISVLPSLPCGATVNLNLVITSATHGAFTVPIVLSSGEPAASPTRYDVTGNVSIPDVGTVESTNTVSGWVSGPVMKVAASLYITHPYDGDLTNISLIGPDGTTVLLSGANAGSGQNYGTGLTPDGSRTTFDDSAASPITAGAAPVAGTYRPLQSLTGFIGKNPNGNWRLHIQDGYGGSLGTLRGWSLFLYPVACAPGGGACALCGITLTNTLTASSATQAGRLVRNGVASACGSSKPYPGLNDSTSRSYHAYSFYNGGSNACITVTLTSSGSCDLFSAAHLGDFNPASLSQNYLAAAGNSTANSGGTIVYSFDMLSDTIFTITVHEVGAGLGGTPYQLNVSGGDCAPVLTAAPAGTGVLTVSWPILAGGYQLESSSQLSPASWSTVTNVPSASSNRFSITTNTAGPIKFYRLHTP